MTEERGRGGEEGGGGGRRGRRGRGGRGEERGEEGRGGRGGGSGKEIRLVSGHVNSSMAEVIPAAPSGRSPPPVSCSALVEPVVGQS